MSISAILGSRFADILNIEKKVNDRKLDASKIRESLKFEHLGVAQYF